MSFMEFTVTVLHVATLFFSSVIFAELVYESFQYEKCRSVISVSGTLKFMGFSYLMQFLSYFGLPPSIAISPLIDALALVVRCTLAIGTAPFAIYILIRLHRDAIERRKPAVEQKTIDESLVENFIKEIIEVCIKHNMVLMSQKKDELSVLKFRRDLAEYILKAEDHTDSDADRRQRLKDWFEKIGRV